MCIDASDAYALKFTYCDGKCTVQLYAVTWKSDNHRFFKGVIAPWQVL